MSKEIMGILNEFKQGMKAIFRDDLCSVRLYGSFARGDYHKNSDIDVMVLVNTPEDKINSYYDRVSDCVFDLLLRYNVDISPVVKNIDHYNYWKDALPYYSNIEQEGIFIYDKQEGQ